MKQSNVFSGYTDSYAAITTFFQEQVYDKTAKHARGHVLDAGSGCAKLAPYLETSQVHSYTAIDWDSDMVNTGNKLLTRLERKSYSIQLADILESEGSYDTIVSIQSYYSWADSLEILNKLFHSTTAGGTLLLATANNRLNIEHLISRSFRAHILHPMWPEFVKHNRRLAAMPHGRFVSLDTLIAEVKKVGYKVQETTTDLFDGSVSWIRAIRNH